MSEFRSVYDIIKDPRRKASSRKKKAQPRPPSLEGCCPYAVPIPQLQGLGFNPTVMGCRLTEKRYPKPEGGARRFYTTCGGPDKYRDQFKTCPLYLREEEASPDAEEAPTPAS